MANVGSGEAGDTLIGQGSGRSATFVKIGTDSSLTNNALVLAQNNNAFITTNVGTLGQVLTSNGGGTPPAFVDIGTNSGLTNNGVIIGGGNNPFTATSAGTAGNVLTSNGAGSPPTFQPAAVANTALYVGNTGSATPTILAGVATLNLLALGDSSTSAATDTVNILSPSCAHYIVDPTLYFGSYQTIQSAINQAVADGGKRTVFIRPGTYTENLTIGANVNLTAFECDNTGGAVTIIGKMTASVAGSCCVSGIYLQTNGDYIVTQSAGTLELKDCKINITNADAFHLTGGTFYLRNCIGDATTPNQTYFIGSGGADIKVYNCFMFYGVGTPAVSTLANCFFAGIYSVFFVPFQTTGNSVFGAGYCSFDLGGSHDSLCLDFQGTGAESHVLRYCILTSETNACLSCGAGNETETYRCSMTTDGANVVIGSGSWVYSGDSFDGLSQTASVSNQTAGGAFGPRITTTAGPQILSGSGSPNGSITAPKGSFYMRTNGSTTNDRAYINTNGGTAWTAVITAT